MWKYFFLGLLVGWLLEWIIDWFYWRRGVDPVATSSARPASSPEASGRLGAAGTAAAACASWPDRPPQAGRRHACGRRCCRGRR